MFILRRYAALAIPALLLNQACGDDNPITPGTGGNGGVGSTSSAGSTTDTATSTGSTGGGTGTGGALPAAPDLDPKLLWYGTNREALDTMIDERGVNGAGYDPAHKPVAAFDWDNTTIKNDIGDLTTFWLLAHDKILQPPAKTWTLTSPFLTSDAAAALTAACGGLAAPGEPLPTSTNTACADEILSVYSSGATTGAKTAFAAWNYRTMDPTYAWAAQLTAGYTPKEVAAFAQQALDAALAAPLDATQTVGTKTVNAYARIYDQTSNLIDVLQKNGFDVWVVSASPQYVVEPFAARVNVASDHVIGIRALLDAGGKLTYNIEGCGVVPDGTNDGAGTFTGNSLITYIDGKRCWINRVIFGDKTAKAADQNPDPKLRIAFGAGDSDTDVSFLRDATAMKLVINRNKNELMCNAYNNYGKKWLINPMFISPKAQLATPYACSKTACKDKDGASGPCLDEGTTLIPDQQDTVF
ncbi:MAG: haloacid dehalogenase-like hydrolase [Byssovorax sp.]